MKKSFKSSFKISLTSLTSALFCLLWFVQSAYLPSNIYVIVKILRLVFGGVITIKFMLNHNMKRWDEYLPVPIMVMALLMSVSTMHANRSISQLTTAMGYSFSYMAFFVIFAKNSTVERANVMGGFRWMIEAIVLLDIVNILLKPEGIWRNATGKAAIYINGGKFTVCYLYLLFTIIMCFEDIYRHGKFFTRRNLILLLVGVIIELRSKCVSGFLGICLFISIVWFYGTGKKDFQKHKKRTWLIPFLLILFGLLVYLILFLRIQERFSWFNYIMYDVLQKNLSLDGRYRIYTRIFGLMKGNWLFGYGIGNNIIYNNLMLQNAQNGFFEIMLDYGFIGMITLVWFIMSFYRKLLKLADSRWVRGIIIATLITYLYFAIFEVPFGLYFYMTCSVLYYYVVALKHSETVVPDT